MGIRATLMRAAGAFLLTAVLFTAAIVIAHSLAIPDPVSRILPVTRYDPPETAGSEAASEDVALTTGPDVGTPLPLDDVPPQVTAVPTLPPDEDDASGDEGEGDEGEASGEQEVALDDGDDAAPAEPAEPEPESDDNQQTTSDNEPAERSGSRTPAPAQSPPEPAPETPSTQTSSRVTEPTTGERDDDRDDGPSWWDWFRRDDDDDRDGRDGDGWDDRDWDDRDGHQSWWGYFGDNDRPSWWDQR